MILSCGRTKIKSIAKTREAKSRTRGTNVHRVLVLFSQGGGGKSPLYANQSGLIGWQDRSIKSLCCDLMWHSYLCVCEYSYSSRS